MISDFYQLLADRIDPALITVPTVDEKFEAEKSIEAKQQMSLLGKSRLDERTWKNQQRRSVMSRSTLFLNKKPDLLKPKTVINTVKQEVSLLGNR